MNIYEQITEKIRLSKTVVAKYYEVLPNPDFLHRTKIKQAIKENDGYCCCKFERIPENKCICKEFQDQQSHGFCHCGQFYKVLNAPTVCLCGSTKFKDKFFEIAKDFTLKGYIVTMPMVFVHSGDEEVNEVQKEYLDEIHKAKIAAADLVYIINPNNYIGKSTTDEIEWAKLLDKKIEYLEN